MSIAGGFPERARSLSDLENATHENARGDVLIFSEGVLMVKNGGFGVEKS